MLAWRAAHAWFGVPPMGMEPAAARFFNSSVSELDASELAGLIGLLQQPYGYQRNITAWTARRDFFLSRMLDRGIIDEHEYQVALATPLRPGQLASTQIDHPIGDGGD